MNGQRRHFMQVESLGFAHGKRPAVSTCDAKGFTLVELLVVIAIIMLLVSLLMPAMGQAMAVAKRSDCAASLHQQGLGMQNYVAAYHAYPGHATGLRHSFPYAIWPTRIRRYAGRSREVFNCASREEWFEWPKVTGSGDAYAGDKDAEEWFYDVGERLLNVHATPFSYGYNDWGNHRAGPVEHQRGLGGDIRWGGYGVPELPMDKVVKPAEMIAIGDSRQTGSWDFNLDPGDVGEHPSKLHFGGSNMVFCDAHTEWNLYEYWTDVDTTTARGKSVARQWNNHNKWTND